MQAKEFLKNVCKEIKYKPIREEISEELMSHIEEQKETYMEYGISENDAEERAVEQMGNAEEIGKNLNRIHKPRLNIILCIAILCLLFFGILTAIIRNMGGISNLKEVLYFINYSGVIEYIMWIVFAVLCGIVIYFMDYRKIKKYSNKIYLIATIIMAVCIFDEAFDDFTYRIAILRYHVMFTSPVVIAVPLYIISFAGFLDDIDWENKLKIPFGKTINIDIVCVIFFCIISIALLKMCNITFAVILGIAYLVMGIYKIFVRLESKGKCINRIWKILAISSVFIVFLGMDIASRNVETDFSSIRIEKCHDEILETSKMFGESEVIKKEETGKLDSRTFCKRTFKY